MSLYDVVLTLGYKTSLLDIVANYLLACQPHDAGTHGQLIKLLGFCRAMELCELYVKVCRGKNEKIILLKEMKNFMQYYVELKMRAQARLEVLGLSLNVLDTRNGELPSRVTDEDIAQAGRYQVATHLATTSREFMLGRMAVLKKTIAMCDGVIKEATVSFHVCT